MFGRKPKPLPTPPASSTLLTPALIHLIAISSVELASKTDAAIEKWGIGSADKWSADFAAGTVSFTFPDHSLVGPVEFIGSWAAPSSTWMWGWANESLPEHVKSASTATREFGTANSLEALTTPTLGNLDESLSNDLASVTVEIARLAGLYHAPTANGFIFLGFTEFAKQ